MGSIAYAYGSLYNSALSFGSLSGCSTCSSITDKSILTPPTGNSDGYYYSYELFGYMMTDQYCLLLDSSNPSCLKAFSFFVFSTFNEDVNAYPNPYLGLAPIDDLNGPSYVGVLNSTGNMRN